MADKKTAASDVFRAPCALFLGDFNAGKSTLINALLRRDALNTAREESMALPTFLLRTDAPEATFAALGADAATIHDKEHEEFLVIRQDRNNDPGYVALAGQLPALPYAHLVMVDTAGASSETARTVDLARITDTAAMLAVIVTDIEYWNARHTMEFILEQQTRFGDGLIVVANKADHLNASEIRRIRDKAERRMKSFGMQHPPRFFPLSARLECARNATQNEYRHRTRPEVRDLCDGGFDALRVALYEFEAAHLRGGAPPSFGQVFGAPAFAPFIESEGSVAA
ncbi:MAG: dynamin family protein [Candidatus Hydrogenedentota bacterium]